MTTATIWTLTECPYCVKAKKLLDFKGIKYEEKTGFHANWKTVPYIEIDGKSIGGFTELSQFIRRI